MLQQGPGNEARWWYLKCVIHQSIPYKLYQCTHNSNLTWAFHNCHTTVTGILVVLSKHWNDFITVCFFTSLVLSVSHLIHPEEHVLYCSCFQFRIGFCMEIICANGLGIFCWFICLSDCFQSSMNFCFWTDGNAKRNIIPAFHNYWFNHIGVQLENKNAGLLLCVMPVSSRTLPSTQT